MILLNKFCYLPYNYYNDYEHGFETKDIYIASYSNLRHRVRFRDYTLYICSGYVEKYYHKIKIYIEYYDTELLFISIDMRGINTMEIIEIRVLKESIKSKRVINQNMEISI